MKTWQIQTKHGFILDFITAVTAIEALNRHARHKYYQDWTDMCKQLNLPEEYEASQEFRIVV